MTLLVFAPVNLSLFNIATGRRPGPRRQRSWGLVGAALTGRLLAFEMVRWLI